MYFSLLLKNDWCMRELNDNSDDKSPHLVVLGVVDLGSEDGEVLFGGAVLGHHLPAVGLRQRVLVVVESVHVVTLHTAVHWGEEKNNVTTIPFS